MLVVIGSTMFVPSTTHAFPAGAGEYRHVEEGAPEPADGSADRRSERSQPAFWRGRPPLICPARECPDLEPTFCLVDGRVGALLRRLRSHRCPDALDVRHAARGRPSPIVRTHDLGR